MKKVVSIVDNNCFFQQVIINALKESSEFELGKIYTTAEDGMQMLKSPPDIVFVEIQLPGVSGIELIRALYLNCSIQCIVYSKLKDDEYIISALKSGASGYILKEAIEQEIHFALQEIQKGGAPLSPYITRRLISFFQQPENINNTNILSEREREILQLLAKGLQYKQIADKLYISSETVKRHLHNTYQKLGVQNKIEAINKLYMLRDQNTSGIPKTRSYEL